MTIQKHSNKSLKHFVHLTLTFDLNVECLLHGRSGGDLASELTGVLSPDQRDGQRAAGARHLD